MKRIVKHLPILFLFLFGACETKTKTVDTCGDGFLDPGEQCDGSQMSVLTCDDLGYYEQQGVLTCRSDCTFDLSVCTGGRCGDRNIQTVGGEDCDGENLAGLTCQGLYLGGGTLGCLPSCRWDTTRCEITAVCGDGTVAAPFESCESTDLQGETCETLGYYGGDLACAADCRAFEVSDCVAEGRCGDELVQGAFGEVCDGTSLGGETCEDLGYHGGDLACSATCTAWDEGDCTAVGWCGDGVIQVAYGEQCDGGDLDAQTCVTRGFGQASGALLCSAACEFDETACVPESTNADLATLTVSSGELTPVFSAGTTSYTVTVPMEVTALAVTATTANPYSIVDLAPSQPMTLALGENPASVMVTAESGVQKTYTVVVIRTLDYLSPHIGAMIYVPTGTFQRDATPTNLSTTSAFRMSLHEITRAQWTAVTGWADPSNLIYSSGTSDPVQRVSWYDAIVFCNKLSLLEGLTPVYSVSGVDFTTLNYAEIPTATDANWNASSANWAANGYRLPTEMEWLWAAMGADTANPGVTNTTGYMQAFAGSTGSNAIDDYAWYATNSESKTHPAGTKLSNELGLFDMSGNVMEWAWDWFGTYPTGTVTDSRGPASGSSRMYLGASWSYSAALCVLGNREYVDPYARAGNMGFRVVRP